MITIARLSAMTRSRPQLRSSRRSGCAAPGATVVLISAFGSMFLTCEQLNLYHAASPRASATDESASGLPGNAILLHGGARLARLGGESVSWGFALAKSNPHRPESVMRRTSPASVTAHSLLNLSSRRSDETLQTRIAPPRARRTQPFPCAECL